MNAGALWIDHPLVLLFVALALPLGYIGYRVFRLGMSSLRMWSALAARALLIAALSLALAGASAVRETDRMAVVVIVDGSDSMLRFALPALADQLALDRAERIAAGEQPDAAQFVEAGDLTAPVRDFLRRVAGARETDDLFGLVVFGERPVAVVAPTAREAIDVSIDHADGEASDLAAAIRYADMIVPPGVSKRLVVISDGGETSGDALAAARALSGRAGAGTPIDVIPIAYRVENEVMVEALDVAPRATSGATVAVRAVLTATSRAAGTVELLYNGSVVDTNGQAPGTGRRVELDPGRNVVTLEFPLEERTVFHKMEVVFSPDAVFADGEGGAAGPAVDTVVANNRAEAFTVTRGSGVALVLDGRGEAAPPTNALVGALEAAGMSVERRSPQAAPTELLEYQGYDLVVLQDVAAWELSERARARLVEHVELMGGGLVMVGGEESFGAGGWLDSEMAAVLPVRLDLPDEIVVSQAAVAIVLDSSGSMARSVFGSTRTQQAIANAGAAEAVRSLDTTDQLMVVEFASRPSVVVPMGPNTDKERNARLVESITSGGGTRILEAMRVAGDELLEVEANVRHMILLTDGRDDSTRAGGASGEMLRYAERLAEDGITITTIGIGDAEGEALRQIAVAGGGVFYPVDDPRTLPAIFLKEVSIVRRPLIRETPFVPRIADGASPLVLGVAGFGAGETPPRLGGLVLTRTREDPRISYAMLTEDNHPVLAHWAVGRGQVAAFTSDASAEGWAERWVDASAAGRWPGFSTLWAQIARVIARAPVEAGVELRTEVVGDELRISYDAVTDAGNPIEGLSVSGTVTGPEGGPVSVNLTQTGPGRYEATVPATSRGSYVVALTRRGGGQEDSGLVLGGATKTTGPEQRQLQSDVSLLAAIAEATGGRVLALDEQSAREVYDRTDIEPARAATPLWPALLTLAMVILVADIATRRVAWDRLLTREVVSDMQRHTRAAVAGRAQAAAGTVGGLRSKLTRPADDKPSAPVASGGARAVASTPPAVAEQAEEEDPDTAERARRIRERQAKQRERLRAEALDALGGSPAEAKAASRAASPGGADKAAGKPSKRAKADADEAAGDSKDDGAPTEGLLAAKRRAAERRKGREL